MHLPEVAEALQDLPSKDGDLVSLLVDLIKKQRDENLALRTQVQALGPSKAGEKTDQVPKLEDPPLGPLLEDLTTTPWVLWREAESLTRPSYSTTGHRSLTPSVSSPGVASCFGATPRAVRGGLVIESNSAQHLTMQWQGRPRAVLVIVKPRDVEVASTLQDIVKWLGSQGIVVVLEPSVLEESSQMRELPNVRKFSTSDKLEKHIDLVITVGGDGTLTWAVSLFKGPMPPVLSFAAGSLGFLTPFPKDGWLGILTRMFDLHQPRVALPVVCRMRLKVTVYMAHSEKDEIHRQAALKEHKDDSRILAQVECLNEVLVHRGKSGALAKLDVGVHGEKVTLVQGDGVILATPTGSTAYSLAAGGSMVHPGVPAILLTPVSPHSLSFRPAILPDSAVVTVGVSKSARCGAALSVDGKDICTLQSGDFIEVSMSPHPVPTICKTTETGDWFASIHQALQWNRRAEQK